MANPAQFAPGGSALRIANSAGPHKLHGLAEQFDVTCSFPGHRITDMNMGNRSTRLRGRDHGVGYLPRRYRKIRVLVPRVPCAGNRTGNDDIPFHPRTSRIATYSVYEIHRISEESELRYVDSSSVGAR